MAHRTGEETLDVASVGDRPMPAHGSRRLDDREAVKRVPPGHPLGANERRRPLPVAGPGSLTEVALEDQRLLASGQALPVRCHSRKPT